MLIFYCTFHEILLLLIVKGGAINFDALHQLLYLFCRWAGSLVSICIPYFDALVIYRSIDTGARSKRWPLCPGVLTQNQHRAQSPAGWRECRSHLRDAEVSVNFLCRIFISTSTIVTVTMTIVMLIQVSACNLLRTNLCQGIKARGMKYFLQFYSLDQRQNGRRFPDDTPALVHMIWHRIHYFNRMDTNHGSGKN